jgi:Na+/H+ antiporter NhaD/arsenite permease-like protein
LEGSQNLVSLAAILAAVVLQSPLAGAGLARLVNRLFPCPDLTLSPPGGGLVMLAAAVLSWLWTPRRLRIDNSFVWGPIIEVAIIFAGLFVTMGPALHLLQRHAAALGGLKPWQYFWLCGGLSSALDNAPTYRVFATLAAGGPNFAELARDHPLLLEAISCGAVFMGANTYIGNGPNFMVKALAEEAGVRAPTFFGYLVWSGLVLLPVFVVVTLIFFCNN